MKDRAMFSKLTTDHLVDRAIRALSDPDVSPYSEHLSDALKHTLETLAETKRRHGPPPGFDTLRAVSLAVLVDFDAAEADRAAARVRRPTADEASRAHAARVDAMAGAL